jgi:hypothetical protein
MGRRSETQFAALGMSTADAIFGPARNDLIE